MPISWFLLLASSFLLASQRQASADTSPSKWPPMTLLLGDIYSSTYRTLIKVTVDSIFFLKMTYCLSSRPSHVSLPLRIPKVPIEFYPMPIL